jgi:hypothetical protein
MSTSLPHEAPTREAQTRRHRPGRSVRCDHLGHRLSADHLSRRGAARPANKIPTAKSMRCAPPGSSECGPMSVRARAPIGRRWARCWPSPWPVATRSGDTVVLTGLDRLGRSLRDPLGLVEDLAGRGVGLRSLAEQFDSTTATGRLVLHVFGALAEFERALMRTVAGLAAARARGRAGGRPRALTGARRAHARNLAAAGTQFETSPNCWASPARRSTAHCPAVTGAVPCATWRGGRACVGWEVGSTRRQRLAGSPAETAPDSPGPRRAAISWTRCGLPVTGGGGGAA